MTSLFLSNTFCNKEFPNNNGGDFKNLLNSRLDFSRRGGKWGVSMSEIIYEPNFWENIRESASVNVKISVYPPEYVEEDTLLVTAIGINFPKGPPKTNEEKYFFEVSVQTFKDGKYKLKKFNAMRTDNYDFEGRPIEWVRGDPSVGHLYLYKTIYGRIHVLGESKTFFPDRERSYVSGESYQSIFFTHYVQRQAPPEQYVRTVKQDTIKC
jgi:hypothetical protein